MAFLIQYIKMAGIYIHIPFCKQACNYCNFHFSTQQKFIPQLIQCIIKEIKLRRFETNETINTIYFGGGTPSIIQIDFISEIFKSIHLNYIVNPLAEITLEANPDDITEDKLVLWKSIGINRFSLGIQSFIDEELVWMNRSHNSKQALECISLIKKHFNNYSIDLIFGSPLLTMYDWQHNVEKALSFNPPHLSCYALTVEDKTKLGKEVSKKITKNIDDKQQAFQFEYLMNILQKNGYQHYEISNYALPGYESEHNSSYWQGKQYLGFGPSAHSYKIQNRSWNIANNALYIKQIEQDILPSEMEELTLSQQYNEFVMIGIRTAKGIDTIEVLQNFGTKYLNHLNKVCQKLLLKKYIQINESIITLTSQGKLFADAIAVELFID